MSFYSSKKINSDGNNKENEAYIDSMMQNALEKGFFPGAQVIVGTGDFNLISKNYGFHDYTKKQLVKSEDVFDLASMSKVLGATLVTMRLVGDGKLKLKDQVGEIVPMYKNTAISDLTLFELLTHTSGLTPSITFYQALLSTPDNSPLLSKEKSEQYVEPFDVMYVNKISFTIQNILLLNRKKIGFRFIKICG
ncbi:hypothetical protein GCM10022423_34710 [Flavobacterium ginsengiterrae]|uniref:Beta-lactamase-related domain-containing protein n=2 Tax=Flavobacterium ginsengiterrae TaxID=871695 RepID=A0ABP7H215_9FLAO